MPAQILATILAALALAIWLYLLLGRGGFWLSSERDGTDAPALPHIRLDRALQFLIGDRLQ